MESVSRIKWLGVLITLCVSSACTVNHEVKKGLPADKRLETMYMDLEQAQEYLKKPCTSFSIEVSGLYAMQETYLPAHLDTAYLDNLLKAQGFKLVKSGWGNWEKGPRIISLELVKEKCHCTVFKKYALHQTIGENGERKDGFTITEKVVCNATNNGIE